MVLNKVHRKFNSSIVSYNQNQMPALRWILAVLPCKMVLRSVVGDVAR